MAEKENEILGYIEIKSIENETIYVEGIYILPSYRRKGLGKNLIHSLIKHRNENSKKLKVRAYTEAGVAFWKNFGFNIQHYTLNYEY